MEIVQYKISTSVEATLKGKPVDTTLHEICNLCHSYLEWSSSKESECEKVYEDKEYEKLYDIMLNRIDTLEGALCQVLKILEE